MQDPATISPDALRDAKAWPFEQARLLLERIEKTGKSGPVVFETGYGPSGLPHIGTFGEVVRTTMVRNAFIALTKGQVPTQLLCVSDDMDGMRKVPDNVPNPDALLPYLQKPLTDVPDPFGTHEGFAQHNNARLRGFLDNFGFDYEFRSATQLYRSGAFDATLLRALERFDEIMAVMLPSLGPERRATYSPFLPISPTTGRVLYVPMKAVDAKAGTVTFEDEDGTEITMPVTGGRVKMQWKPDFGMRWAALGVDFEMYGKDHQTNGPIYSKICRILGAEPPVQYCYELFLDQNGEKISKSKGNGISVEDWLTYAPAESLSLYNFQKPRTAKRLYFDVIPRAVDDYIAFLDAYPKEEPARQLDNPVWHIHAGAPPPPVGNGMTYGLLLKLVAAASSQSEDVLWGFIKQYRPELDRTTHPYLDRLVGLAVAYYHDRILPHRVLRAPTDLERAAMMELRDYLAAQGDETPSAEDIQTQVFEIGKRHAFENLRDWFKGLYEVLLGESDGPRFGTFAALVGARRLVAQIDARLEGAAL